MSTCYNENELNELFEKSKDDPLNLMIRVASYYGLRRSEVLGLKWDAFDFENKTIAIKHKAIQGKKDNKKTNTDKNPGDDNKKGYRFIIEEKKDEKNKDLPLYYADDIKVGEISQKVKYMFP